jgi:hypothetical protein
MLRLATHAMATRFELVLAAEGRDARAAGEEALARIEACDARYSLFRRDSLVSRINREAVDRPVRLDEETYELLALCLELRDETRGAFDVSVGRRMRELGFHPGRGSAAGRTSSTPGRGRSVSRLQGPRSTSARSARATRSTRPPEACASTGSPTRCCREARAASWRWEDRKASRDGGCGCDATPPS